jgi:hypothetical protein
MICRRCGNRIPEHLAVRESFQCPECGRQFGQPTPERVPASAGRSRYSDNARSGRYSEAPRAPRSNAGRYAEDRRYESRPRSSYPETGRSRYTETGRRAPDRYAGDDRYAPDRRQSRSRFDQERDGRQYANKGYYAEEVRYDDVQQYADGYYDDDLSDLRGGGEPRPAGMKLSTVLTVIILGIAALIVVFCVDAAIHPPEVTLALDSAKNMIL